jgi:hypothetical protein
MMEKENKYIESLLERFFEGQTSNEEERQLYRFFEQETIPDELAQYKPVIKYFESGLADELDVNKTQPTGIKKVHPAGLAKKQWLVWGSVAASALLVLFTSIYVFDRIESADPYAGSYIIRNGVRITDLNLIKPELEAAIQKSLLIEQDAEQFIERLTTIDDSQEVEISQRFQEHNQQILDNTQDEKMRLEAEKILNQNL